MLKFVRKGSQGKQVLYGTGLVALESNPLILYSFAGFRCALLRSGIFLVCAYYPFSCVPNARAYRRQAWPSALGATLYIERCMPLAVRPDLLSRIYLSMCAVSRPRADSNTV